MSETDCNTQSKKFNFKDAIIVLPEGRTHIIHGTIQGKIKDIDAYIISLNVRGYWEQSVAIGKFGVPNRHLEVEWGRFSGGDREFIAPPDALTKVDR